MKISDQDRRILKELQRDCSASLSEISERAGVASSTLWRKVQDFEATGLISGRVAILDPKLADTGLCVFASVRIKDHTEENVAAFGRIVASSPEIMEAHAVAGTADYLVKLRCKDVEAYETFMTHNLLRNPAIKSVSSLFSLKELKYTTKKIKIHTSFECSV